MEVRKCTSSGVTSRDQASMNYLSKVQEKARFEENDGATGCTLDVDVDVREVYFLIMHFLSSGPCQKTFAQICNELMENQLLPRRYHAWFSRSGEHSGHSDDDGISCPLSYNKLVERNPHVDKDHLVKLFKQLLLTGSSPTQGMVRKASPTAADVPTLLGSGSFSLLGCDREKRVNSLPAYLRWPHMRADLVRGLSLREIGGGFTKHHRAPSVQSASHAIAKPSIMVQKMQNIKRIRGHRDAVYCAIFDRSGRYVITGADDRLVKIWSMETAFLLASCRGHEGDITDLAVSSNNAVVASASNDFVIRVWCLPDGMPISVLRGHTAAVTAIAFSPRPSAPYHLLSSSDDGTCRIWDARSSNHAPQIYMPKPLNAMAGRSVGSSHSGPSSSNYSQDHRILCCAYNANGTYFVTGSSDTYARVWNASKVNATELGQPVHETDTLSGHENDVNYVQFSGCAVAPRSSISDISTEENIPKFRNSWFCHDNIVTCSRDGSAIIWVPKSRKLHGKATRWTRAYHLKVPPPPLPPQAPRGGPRQRLLPTPRGVNMIVWSLDNRFVLAAIMDCRICVWNAVDGSLVHSLTGHSASSYVLDVHPFNPRIAMSAGYDGKTIVWDIWEGTPIKVYEIGRFKLVDGKFSPDGTSIVLSDDVGQIYLLNTGQGDSQKDAKYDQFFLGDYRPLIRDTNGYVLDQETQLPPHKRNVQDPLCDSGMVPYPEPYQSMYQRRRLGALGREWHPSSIKFAVGPDFHLGQDYQMPPLEDLERMIEPLPEFMDPMTWEPEIEVISDDNDSEYNVPEDYSSEAERGNLSGNTSSDSEGSSEEFEAERRQREGICRSRKKRLKNEVDSMTSFGGRRIKKRNLEEHSDSVSGTKKIKKSKRGRKSSKRRSPKAKTPRPQRLAARNALTMFSQVSGSSTDEEDEDDSEVYSSESESLQDFDAQKDISARNMQSVQQNCMNDQSLLNATGNDSGPLELPVSQSHVSNRKKLVLKLPIRHSKDNRLKSNNQADVTNLGSAGVILTDVTTSLDTSSEPHKEQRIHVTGDEEQLGTDGVRVLTGARNKELLPQNTHMSSERSNLYDHQVDGIISAPYSKDEDVACKGYSGAGSAVPNLIDNTKQSHESEVNLPRKLPKLKIKMRAPSKLKFNTEGEDQTSGALGEDEATARSFSLKQFHDLHPALSMKATSYATGAVNRTFKVTGVSESAGTSRGAFNSLKPYGELASEEWMPRRSSRNRQVEFFDDDQKPSGGMNPNSPVKKAPWLMLVEHEECNNYIPQLGDEVAYLRQGHQEFLEISGSRELGPWNKNKGIRAVEMCKVEGLDYATVGGSGESCCKITLKFVDPDCTAFGKTFKLTLPELINFPDFIIEKSRYDAAIMRNWSNGDRCMVWWNLDGQGGGEWYEGHIESSRPKSEDFPDSSWERYYVRYDDDKGEPERHSPWELHDPNPVNLWVQPEMDSESRAQLLSSFSKLERSRKKDYYGIERLNQVAEKLDFCNRFPVPLSPKMIQLRLEKNYYRSLEAAKHDIMVMLSNAKAYVGRNTEMSQKMTHLSNFFSNVFSRL